MLKARIGRVLVTMAALAWCGAPLTQAQCAETWLPGQGQPQPSLAVHAMTYWEVVDNSPLFVMAVGDYVGVCQVMTFDGSVWKRLGDEFDGSIFALTVFDGQLIAGGEFSKAGQIALNHVARWNGQFWEPMGGFEGTYAWVRSFALFQGELIAAGDFAGGVARWDGTQWQILGNGAGAGILRDIVEFNGDLYACATSPYRVMRWDGSGWQQVGPTFSASVNTLGVFAGRLIAGGAFTGQAKYVAQWDGNVWSRLGAGLTDGTAVVDLATFNGELIAIGSFTTAPPAQPAQGIARWNGTVWRPLGAGPDGPVQHLAVSATRLSITGIFETLGELPASDVAEWSGMSWNVLSEIPRASPLDGTPYALREYNGDLVAAGGFTMAGATEVSNIARWDGVTWYPIDAGIGPDYPYVFALDDYAGDLIVAGYFTTTNPSGELISNIGRWDGAELRPLSLGMDQDVFTTITFGSDLVAAGIFHSAGGTPIDRIATWDGITWHPLGGGIDDGWINALAVYRGELIAAGQFLSADGVVVNNIARWDGLRWHSLDAGTNGSVNALAVFNDELVAAGIFTQAGEAEANRIARWDGARWSALGGGLSGDAYAHVNALIVRNGALIAGGTFDHAGGLLTPAVASWNGAEWRDLDGGMDGGTIFALGQYRDELIVGGYFSNAGSITSINWARWGYSCCRGDFNTDGTINLADLGVLLSDYGCTGGSCPGDTDGDGDTDLSDLGTVLSVFGSSCD